jgi:16S rRNA processing protein RimM
LIDLFLIAQFTSAYGEKGYLSLKSFSDFEENTFSLEYVFVDVFGGPRKLFIEDVLKKNEKLLVKLKNFNSNKEIEFLFGKNLYIEQTQTAKLKESEYFIHDLIDCKVIYKNTFFGIVTDIFVLKSNEVLVVKTEDNPEFLIPFISDYISNINLNHRQIDLINLENLNEN